MKTVLFHTKMSNQGSTPLKFIRNEYPGYCVLISCIHFVQALNMSFQEFMNHLPKDSLEILKKFFKEKDPEHVTQIVWDNIHKGKATFENLKKEFFNGKKYYDQLDPFTEAVYEAQCGLKIHEAEDKTSNFHTDAKHHWSNKKIFQFYNAFKDRCDSVPYFTHFVNFIGKDAHFTYPDHIFVTTMEDFNEYTDPVTKQKRKQYRIRAYNSDNQQGMVEQVLKDPVCPLIFGWAKGFPDYGQLPEYITIKPGGTPSDPGVLE